MYIPALIHRGLGNIKFKSFFHMCRLDGVAYDLEKKSGTTFLLLAAISQSILGLLTMGANRKECIKLMSESVEFLIK